MTEAIIIWGCGGHGREVFHLCERAGIQVIGALDERPSMKGLTIDGVKILGDIHDVLEYRRKVKVLCSGVGDPALKKHFFEKSTQVGFEICDPIVHPNVYISPLNRIGKGSMLCEGVTATVGIDIGEHVIINRSATLGHDVRVGDYSTISPGANISGNVDIETGVFIGTGSSIREKVRIGEWSVVGGGAFVAKDVPSRMLYAGVPAIFKKKLP